MTEDHIEDHVNHILEGAGLDTETRADFSDTTNNALYEYVATLANRHLKRADVAVVRAPNHLRDSLKADFNNTIKMENTLNALISSTKKYTLDNIYSADNLNNMNNVELLHFVSRESQHGKVHKLLGVELEGRTAYLEAKNVKFSPEENATQKLSSQLTQLGYDNPEDVISRLGQALLEKNNSRGR